jgi:hypothetical protein
VVLSQAERQDPVRRDFEEQLATMLVMEDGYDVNIIPHLIGLEEDDTGMLCLEGLTAHVVALSWLSPESAFEQLQTLKIPGRFGRTRQTPETPAAWQGIEHPRAVYCLDLGKFTTIDDAREEIRRINQQQPTQVFSIGIGIGDVNAIRPASDAKPTPPKPDRKTDDVAEVDSVAAGDSPSIAESVAHQSDEPATDWDDDESLDRLVDELDELDI